MVDEGSSVTMIEESVTRELGISGPCGPLNLVWTGSTRKTEKDSQVVDVCLIGVGDISYKLKNVRTVKDLGLSEQSFRRGARTGHLQSIPVEEYDCVKPVMLIGLPDSFLAAPSRTVCGGYGDVTAIQTRLGWIVYGGGNSTNSAHQRVNVVAECRCEGLKKAVADFFTTESFGVRAAAPLMSKDDQRAMDLMKENTKFNGTRYSTRLLWKSDEPMPDNRAMAEKRLGSLMAKMDRDPVVNASLRQQIKEYEAKGYVRKLTTEECAQRSSRTWYIPLFTVPKPNKPGHDRIVWDCAATVDGKSLNSFLLTGPDLLVRLPEVLIRLREGPVAVSADATEMYHQVLIDPADHDSQRFLWPNAETGAVEEWVMQVATFGATSSPFQALYVKDANADRFADVYPTAALSIKTQSYVDDWMDSFKSVEEARKCAEEVNIISNAGGFALKAWVSNVRDVIQGQASREEIKVLDEKKEARVLGLCWKVDGDFFQFNVKNLDVGAKPATKMLVLKTLSELWDH